MNIHIQSNENEVSIRQSGVNYECIICGSLRFLNFEEMTRLVNLILSERINLKYAHIDVIIQMIRTNNDN